MLVLQSQKDGHIYHCTMSVSEQRNGNGNVVSADMRYVLPDRYGQEKERAGHSMYCEVKDHLNE